MENGLDVLKKLVITEATNLKKYATKEELDNLDFSKLDSTKSMSCVYGQMTGNCFSVRATDLIEKSAERIYIDIINESLDEFYDDKLRGNLNSSPVNKDRTSYWSPIELFIDDDYNKTSGNNKLLIDFLKGKTDKLEFI